MSKHGVSSNTHTRQQCNHYANQHNGNSAAHKAVNDNLSTQMNPNHSSSSGSSRNTLSKSEFQVEMWPGFLDN